MQKNNPYLERKKRQGKMAHGAVSEGNVSKRIGGVPVPRSGALAGSKGDVKLPEFLIEAKATTSDEFRLKFEWLGKILKEARAIGRFPALFVSFTHGNGRSKRNGDWVLIPEKVFKELIDK